MVDDHGDPVPAVRSSQDHSPAGTGRHRLAPGGLQVDSGVRETDPEDRMEAGAERRGDRPGNRTNQDRRGGSLVRGLVGDELRQPILLTLQTRQLALEGLDLGVELVEP
jgi:hypothetical protein